MNAVIGDVNETALESFLTVLGKKKKTMLMAMALDTT
jgi:hypothetical protein